MVPPRPPATDQVHRSPGAAEKVLLLLETFMELSATGTHPTLTRIARGSGLAKSTTHRLLSLLVARRMIECAGDGTYRHGPALSALAGRALGLQTESLRSVLLPHMVDLYELTHETVSLAVVSGADVVLIERVRGRRNRRPLPGMPDRAPSHRTALGRAMLMSLAGHHAVGTGGATAPRRACDRTAGLLAPGRRQGIVVSTDGVVSGVTCLAVPILSESRRPVAALSVSGFTRGMDVARVAAHLQGVSLTAGLSLLTEHV